MEKRYKIRLLFCRLSSIGVLMAAVLLFPHADSAAQTFICSSNPDYFTKRCSIHPNAITRVINGVAIKGHLVGCQFKSYSCIDNVCKDNFGAAGVPYNFPMTDLSRFCYLLCNAPPCPGKWE